MFLGNKTAVITGASRGIGKAIALKFAENGANIALIYIGDSAEAEQTKAELQGFGVKAEIYNCDVSDWGSAKSTCDAVIKEFGSVDIAVNNAGIIRDQLLLRMSEEDFDAVLNVNLKGAFNIIRHLSRSIMKSPAGRFINITSVSGMMGNAGQANYSASKAGLIGLTKTVAKEFASKGVTCNAIAPGFIETDMTAGLPQSVKEQVNAAVPLKRMGEAEEVANLAVFFASELSSYITGEIIKIDGGMYI
ncbi:MAG: 3-oxoacyl-[acyl-carrier-protein] reductase [Oscillospiraceae bacterium]|nr:3-oxoacyl-[acyl-carrier-protein] reductase [Oscillospiraceae bacterium]